jgi:hypothetical protein
MVQDLDPVGSLEGLLAERVAHLGWRLRRTERLDRAAWATLEAEHVARTTDKPAAGDDPAEREAVLARVIVEDFRYGRIHQGGKVIYREVFDDKVEAAKAPRLQGIRALRALHLFELPERDSRGTNCGNSDAPYRFPNDGQVSILAQWVMKESNLQPPH